MKHKIFCAVCRLSFLHWGEAAAGAVVVCAVCGAKLEIIALEPEIKARRYPQEPETAIRERVDAFACLRGYGFNEVKESLIEGLVEKFSKFGDFYCPCRFEHDPDNVCPCLETRQNRVRKEGSCY
ncbi:MAG: ferredoxin-thioredoxin reductase catalytic domain-containing protein [Bacillota bacterium]